MVPDFFGAVFLGFWPSLIVVLVFVNSFIFLRFQ